MGGSGKKNNSKFNALFKSVRVGDTSALSDSAQPKKASNNKANDLAANEGKITRKSTPKKKQLKKKNGTQTEHRLDEEKSIVSIDSEKTEHKRNTKKESKISASTKQNNRNSSLALKNGTQTEHRLDEEKSIVSIGSEKTEHKRNTKKESKISASTKQNNKNNSLELKSKTQREHKREVVNISKHEDISQDINKPKKSSDSSLLTFDEAPSVDLLSSIQRAVLMVMYESAKEKNMDYTTHKLTINVIADGSGVNNRSVKTTIARLKDKHYISISSRKDGRGGWVAYRLQRGVFFEIKNSVSYEKINEVANIAPTLEIDSGDSLIPDLDLAGLEEFGFKKMHFNNLTNKLSIEDIQQSINHFSWGLRFNPKNEKYKKDAINVLIGCLMKKSIWIEKNYRSDEEIMLDKKLAYEKDKADRIEKKENEIFNQYFEDWSKKLTEEEIKRIVPNLPKGKLAIKPMIIAGLKKHYRENLWKNEMPAEINQLKKELM